MRSFKQFFAAAAATQLFIALASATAMTTAPSGAVVVRPTATTGEYSSLQSAVDSLSTTSSDDQVIFIYAGTYDEQVYIPARKAQLTIYGETTDMSSYTDNTVTITQGLSQDSVSSDDLTATVRAWSAGLKMYNINLVNSRGEGSQALALSAYATEQSYYGMKLIGYQDTLMAETGNQLYINSYIEGAVDFIFGQYARAYFQNCDLAIRAAGTITANGRSSSSGVSYYLFNDCTVDVASGYTVADGATYLGRPWEEYARVVFQKSTLGAVVNSAGWEVWSTSDTRTADVLFGEYDNTGDGASGTRASFATTLTAAVSMATILGSDYKDWVDTTYL
ncbi:hypothetical protein RUND412_003096 [Rhizina undulata]